MMIGGRNSSSRSTYDVFTASQWQELEHQLLTFKYLMSGIPVPPELISTVITHPSSSPRLFPLHQTLPFGWGCFQVGYGRKLDPEPGRCRRTDGKKWRCTKEACPDSKYCERHMHRGKNKTKKPSSQVFPATTPPPNTNSSTTTVNTILPTPTSVNLKPLSRVAASPAVCLPSQNNTTTYPQYKTQKLQSANTASFYPFLSPNNDQTLSFSPTFSDSTQHSNTAPHWFMDPQSYDQPKKEIRYLNEMKGTTGSERILDRQQDIGYNHINKEVKEERFGVDNKDDETQKQLYHHFLGD